MLRKYRKTIFGVKYADLVMAKLALDYRSPRYTGGDGKIYNNARSILNTLILTSPQSG